MLVTTYRIVRAEFAAAAFDGEGAREHGGRWSSPGTAVVYTSGSIPLAMLEVLVHLPAPRLLEHYRVFTVGIPSRLITAITIARLPLSWRESPPPPEAQALGDAWVASGRTAVLRMPSTIDPDSHNYLLNPAHKDFKRIRIGSPGRFPFDRRLAQ